MAYTLGDAARATGKSKPTIAKAIKRGQISAVKAEDGSYQIDPAELHRVYPMASEGNGNPLQRDTPVAPAGLLSELELWRTLATERAEMIRDLRTRLDAADARLDRLMLTDRRERASGDATSAGDVSRNRERFPVSSEDPALVSGGSARNAVSSEREITSRPGVTGADFPRPPWWRRWFR